MENYLFEHSKAKRILYLYRNEPCVVIGRNQNPFVECNLNYLIEHQIPLIRRYSGGGTVYHDLGNLNYSLMTPKAEFSRSKGVSFLKNALKTIAIDTHLTDRNDLVMHTKNGVKKISGSAFKLASQKCYHHGTLLCQSDLKSLKLGLKADDLQIDSSAVTSVPMSVANINISVENAIDCLINYCTSTYSTGNCDLLQESDAVEQIITLEQGDFLIPKLLEQIQLLKSFPWIYERTPKFKQVVEINQQSRKIKVQYLQIIESEDPKLISRHYLELSSLNLTNSAQLNLVNTLNRVK